MGGGATDKTAIAVGVLTIGIGIIPVLVMLGILPRGTPGPDPAPDWLGWMIGAVFVAAGIIVVLKGLANSANDASGLLPASVPGPIRALHDLLSVGIVFGLAAMFTWVAFGPGPRHFAMSMSVGGLSVLTHGSGDMPGRIAFGFGAILFWCVAAAMALQTARRWR
ncbi:MAG TPA: hypothetical protein VGM17_11370 [Rhizomicrobium sp.]